MIVKIVWKHDKLIIRLVIAVLTAILGWSSGSHHKTFHTLLSGASPVSQGEKNKAGREHAGGLVTWWRPSAGLVNIRGKKSSWVRKLKEQSVSQTIQAHCWCQSLASKVSPLPSVAVEQTHIELLYCFLFFLLNPSTMTLPHRNSFLFMTVSAHWELTRHQA